MNLSEFLVCCELHMASLNGDAMITSQGIKLKRRNHIN